MTAQRSKLDKATDIVAKIIWEQIETLPQAAAAAKRKRQLAVSLYGSDKTRVFVKYPDLAQELHKL